MKNDAFYSLICILLLILIPYCKLICLVFYFRNKKIFKKPNLEYLGQNRADVENCRRHRDQGLNLEENPWNMLILEDFGEFQWFWVVLEERKKEEF